MADKTYNYFVSFAHRDGFGNGCFELDEPITTFDVIQDVEEEIMRRDKSAKDVTVLNYQLLSADK